MRVIALPGGSWALILGITLALLFQTGSSDANSLNGNTGLVTIPTAEMLKDREVSFGLNWLDRNYNSFSDSDRYNVLVAYARFGYLPFLEFSPSLTRYATTQKIRRLGLGGRSITIRLRLFTEEALFPSVVLGLQDPIGTGHSNASYLVTSKTFRPYQITTDLHLGYGVDWIEATRYQFVGLFGGVSVSPRPFVAFMFEYDTEKLNCGMRMSIHDHLELLFALLNFDTFSGGIGYRFGI